MGKKRKDRDKKKGKKDKAAKTVASEPLRPESEVEGYGFPSSGRDSDVEADTTWSWGTITQVTMALAASITLILMVLWKIEADQEDRADALEEAWSLCTQARNLVASSMYAGEVIEYSEDPEVLSEGLLLVDEAFLKVADFAPAFLLQGDIRGQQDALIQATESYRSAVTHAFSEQQRALALRKLGTNLWRRGEYKESRATFAQAVGEGVELARARNSFGILLSESGLSYESWHMLSSAIRDDPEWGISRLSRLKLLIRLADRDSSLYGYAAHEADTCMEQMGKNWTAFESGAIAHSGAGNFSRALECSYRAEELGSTSQQARSLRPGILLFLGDPDGAINEAQSVVEDFPRDEAAQFLLVAVLWDEGRHDEAEDAVRSALSALPESQALRAFKARRFPDAGW